MHTKLFILLILVNIGPIFTATTSSYTERERNAIQELRKRVKSHIYADYMNSDEFLITWIRDRSFDLDKAEQKLTKSIQWRKENEVDTILNDPEVKRYSTKFPFKIVGHDGDGAPFLEWKFGPIWKLRKEAIAGNIKKLNRQFTYLLESGITEVRRIRAETGVNITQYYLITDMSGYSLREHGCLACVPFFLACIEGYEANYPQTMKYILLINTPRIFESVGQLVRPLMSPGTREAFKVFSLNDQLEWKNLIRKTKPKDISSEYV